MEAKATARGAAGQHKGKNKTKVGCDQQSGMGNDRECFRKDGHISANCPTRGETLRLQAMGFAITGGGFYNIEVEQIREEEMGDQFVTVIKFDNQKPLSALQVSDELKNLVDDLWDWQVTKVSESEFTVRFPSRATLKMGTGSGKLYLPLSKSKVSIREVFIAPRPGKAFPPTWVQLTGLPRDMIEKDRLMAGMVMIGRPLEGTVQLTVNGDPYTIGLQAELGRRDSGGARDGGPPRPPAPPRDDDGDEESEVCSQETWNRHGWKKSNDKEQGQAEEVESQKGGDTGAARLSSELGSFSAPQLGRSMAGPFNQHGSNVLAFPSLLVGERSKAVPTAVDVEGVALKKSCAVGVALDADNLSLVSGETASQVLDPTSD
ncbi:hypothetical protein QYE76_050900 [Lolium multiflorum]|uniref:DUF4283 domain-containing protein n=1 Tax=Lolium multiflorum TaxID=4521 RepID=A0AAD8WI91_LOLMU|nr:hypothetical protein QYE76_050900 [Lolium multiflorum]